MNVSPNFYNDALQGLDRINEQTNNDLTELTTGKRVNSISDDPLAAAEDYTLTLQTNANNIAQTTDNSVNTQLTFVDSTFSSVEQLLNQAISLGTEGANGTLSASQKDSIATELTGILGQVQSLANQTYEGQYIFSGTNTSTAPFATSATQPDGVTYNGNSNQQTIDLGTGQNVQTTLNGAAVFTAPGADVFNSLNSLITGLQNGTDVTAANSELGAAYLNVVSQRSSFAGGITQSQQASDYLQAENTNLASEQNNVVGADMSSVLSDLSQNNVAQSALLQAIGSRNTMSLVEFLNTTVQT